MNNLEQLFVPYEEALELKELGFNEPCLCRYHYKKSYPMLNTDSGEKELIFELGQYLKQTQFTILAPTYQQAFKWFRESYKIHSVVNVGISDEWYFELFNLASKRNDEIYIEQSSFYKTFEEAELACLRKLIEIAKEK